MGFKLKPSDRKTIITEKDPLELELDSRLNQVSPQSLEVKEIKKEDNTEFNPWDYIRVVNVMGDESFQAKKDEKVIIGHRGNSVLGNKHPMKVRTMAERDRVIAENNMDVDKDLAIKGPIWKALQSIADDIVENKQKIALECYCAPAKCHLDPLVHIVVDMALEKIKAKNKDNNEIQNTPINPSKPKL